MPKKKLISPLYLNATESQAQVLIDALPDFCDYVWHDALSKEQNEALANAKNIVDWILAQPPTHEELQEAFEQGIRFGSENPVSSEDLKESVRKAYDEMNP